MGTSILDLLQIERPLMTESIVDPDKFVTVGKFLEPANAQMAKGMLEAAGVETFMVGESLNHAHASPASRGKEIGL